MDTVEICFQNLSRDGILNLLRRDATFRHRRKISDTALFREAYRDFVFDRQAGWEEKAAADCRAFKRGGPVAPYIESAVSAIFGAGK
jgi:hypothetical protein